MKKKIYALSALMALTACENREIDPIVSSHLLESPACANGANSRTRSARTKENVSATYSTIASGDWNSPDIWEGGLIPTSGSSGQITINHYVWMASPPPGSSSGLSFTGDLIINHEGALDVFKKTGAISVHGNVTFNDRAYFEEPVSIHQGNLFVHAMASISGKNKVTLDAVEASIQGKFQILHDIVLVNDSTLTIAPTGVFRASDDLHLGSIENPADSSKIVNQSDSSCESHRFNVQDSLFLYTPNVRIQSVNEGRLILGGGSVDNEQHDPSLSEIFARVYGVPGTNYRNQVTANVVSPSITVRPSETFPSAPYCGGPLPVRLVSWKGEFLPPNQVRLTWKTTNESNSGQFTVYQAKPCESVKNARAVITEKAKGKTEAETVYTKTFPVTEAGIHSFQLQQTDLDGRVQTFNWISVKVGN